VHQSLDLRERNAIVRGRIIVPCSASDRFRIDRVALLNVRLIAGGLCQSAVRTTFTHARSGCSASQYAGLSQNAFSRPT
jgi:hypothetical protein